MSIQRLATICMLALLTGCQSVRITDPKTGVIYENKTTLMKQGPKTVTVKDGAREVTVTTGVKDQTEVANKLIELGASLK